MAGMDWFRWHHGSVTDPKFQLVARKAGASLPDVLAVWSYLLEQASASEDRGSFGAVDAEALDVLFNFPETDNRTANVLTALDGRGLTAAGRIVAWERRQPKREREDNSTPRVQALRDRQRHETPRNANSGQETPRGEERRQEEIPPLAPNGACPPAANEPPASGAKKYETPDCPHAAIVALYHELLPTLPRVEVMNDSRRGMLRQRWREVCADQKYDEAQGLEWWRDYFGFVASSKFLTGRAKPKPGDEPFLADFEWLIGPKNFAKVIERRYHRSAA